MTPLYINHLPSPPRQNDELARGGTELSLNKINWPEFPYRPEVTLFLGWETNRLHLLYRVKESSFRALVTLDNGPVCTDSCVEFFFMRPGDREYINLELNALGTVHIMTGTGRENRQALSEEKKKGLAIGSSHGSGPQPLTEEETYWELAVTLPMERLYGFREDLSEFSLMGNFYKCGDCLSRPHFLSWAPVKTDKPDFHTPQFFREIHFRR